MDGSSKEGPAWLLEAIDLEVAEVRGRITYHRTALLAVLAFSSALFWDLFGYVPAGGVEWAHVVRLAPYILPALYFEASAAAILITYRMRAGIPDAKDMKFDIEYLPHTVVALLIMVMGALSSLVALTHSLLSPSGYGWTGQFWFACSLIFFVALTLVILGSRYIGKAVGWVSETAEKAGRPNFREYVSSHKEGLWKFFRGVSFTFVLVGIGFLLIAWQADANRTYFAVAIKGTLALILITNALERVGAIQSAFGVLDEMKAARRRTFLELLKEDPTSKTSLENLLLLARKDEGKGQGDAETTPKVDSKIPESSRKTGP